MQTQNVITVPLHLANYGSKHRICGAGATLMMVIAITIELTLQRRVYEHHPSGKTYAKQLVSTGGFEL